MTIELATNGAAATLHTPVSTTPVAGTSESWSVDILAGVAWPAIGSGVQTAAKIDNEIVLLTAGTTSVGTQTLTVTRGASGTTPATHQAGVPIRSITRAEMLNTVSQTNGPADRSGGVSGALTDGVLDYRLAARAFTWTAGAAVVAVGPIGTMTLTVKQNGSSVATLTIAASATSSGALSAPVTVAAGDLIEIDLAGSAGASSLAYYLAGLYT